jgi:predicted DNA-binding WGR domain protein
MTLIREQKNRKDYYSINIYPTLFDDFFLIYQCGKRTCMRQGKREYFDTKREALLHSLSVMESKREEGFRLNR